MRQTSNCVAWASHSFFLGLSALAWFSGCGQRHGKACSCPSASSMTAGPCPARSRCSESVVDITRERRAQWRVWLGSGELFLGTQDLPLLGLHMGVGGGVGEAQQCSKARSRRVLGSHPRASPHLARGGPVSSPFPLNWSQEVLTHYSLAGRPWPRAKANRPPAGLGGEGRGELVCQAWELEAPIHAPPLLQPACYAPCQPSPSPAERSGLGPASARVGSGSPCGAGAAQGSLSAKGEATSASPVANAVASPATDQPPGQRRRRREPRPQTCISGQYHRQQ